MTMYQHLDIHSHMPDAPLRSMTVDEFLSEAGDVSGQVTVGLHPWDTSSDDVEMWMRLLPGILEDSRVAALGEVGLDTKRGVPIEAQAKLLVQQISMAEATGKPVMLHIVRAYDRLINIADALRPTTPWVIHSVAAKPDVIKRLAERGIYMSVGRHTPDATIAAIPSDKLLVETDNTLSAPAISIDEVVSRVATLRHCSPEEIAAIVSSNIERIFRR